jgi:hypothetical protein
MEDAMEAQKEVKFTWSGILTGSGPQTQDSINGSVSIDHWPASFQTMALKLNNFEPEKLGIEIACLYTTPAKQLVEGPYVANGCVSPPVAAPRDSAYIQAFKIELTGTEKEKFTVSYSVHVEKTNVDTSAQQPVGDFLGSDGSWAGFRTPLPECDVWITKFTINIGAKSR